MIAILFGVTVLLWGSSYGNIARDMQLQYHIRFGYDADIEQYPYIVSLQFGGIHRCGGAIVNSKTILTAAHCIFFDNSNVLLPMNNSAIRAGSSHWNNSGVLIPIRGFTVHPEYNETELVKDIALLFLAEALHFGKAIKPIQLWNEVPAIDEEGNTLAVLVGWGWNEMHIFPHILHAKNVSLIPIEMCRKLIGNKNLSTVNVVCDGSNGSIYKGDAGGPLILDNRLLGIVSWRIWLPFHTLQPFPTVYVSVPDLRHWIERNALHSL